MEKENMRLEAVKIAVGLFRNADGCDGVSTNDNDQFIHLADTIYNFIVEGKKGN